MAIIDRLTTCDCIITRTLVSLSIQFGGKTCVLDLTRADGIMTPEEQAITVPMEDAGPLNTPYRYELSVHELTALIGLKDRIKALPLPCPDVPPALTETPKIPTVVPETPPSRPAAIVKPKPELSDAQQDVLRHEQRYATSKGVDDAERRLTAMQDTVRRIHRSYHLLQYDIPDVLTKNGTCPNPSDLLWGYGFRMTKSVWVIPTINLQRKAMIELLAHWKSHPGVIARTVRFADEEVQNIKDIASEALDQELRRIHTALIVNIGAADEKLAAFLKDEEKMKTANSLKVADSARDNRVRAVIKTCAEELDRAVKCAEEYDATENVVALCQGLREAIRARQADFNSLMRDKDSKPSNVSI